MMLARRTGWSVAVAAVCAVLIGSAPAGAAGLAPSPAATTWPGPSPVASDWPQTMRGSFHEGWNQVETTLSPTTVTNLAPVWDTQIGNSGDSPNSGSPIVVGGAVYIGGPDVSRRDAATGAVVWRTSIAAPGGGAEVLTTPAYDHGIVIAVTSWDRSRDTLAALNATTGAVIWKRRLPGSVSASPSTANGVVYVGIDDNTVMALRLATGSVKWTWSTTIVNYGLVSSPTTDGKGVYFSTGGGTMVWGLDAATGAQRWGIALDGGNGYTVDGLMVSLLAGRVYAGNVAGAVYSINATTGAIVWRADLGGAVWRAVTATPQAIVALPTPNNNLNQATALSPADGHVLWNYTVPGYVSSGVTTANGVAYLGWADQAQRVSYVDALALTTGTRLARIQLPAPDNLSDPTAYEPEPMAISSGRLYVARWQELISLAPSGAPVPPQAATAHPAQAAVRPAFRQLHAVYTEAKPLAR